MVGPLSSPPSPCHPSRMTLMCCLVALMVMFVVFPPPHSCLAPAIFKFKLFKYSIFSFFLLWLVRVFCASPLFLSDLCCRLPGLIAHLMCEAHPPLSSGCLSIFSFFPLRLVRVFCASPLFSSNLCCRLPGSIAHLACEAQPPQSSLSAAVMHKSWVSC